MKNILIFAAHQSHVRSNAGGYVRLQQFLKHKPSYITCYLVDQDPTIYQKQPGIIIETLKTPSFVSQTLYKSFLLRSLIERISIAIFSYTCGAKLIARKSIQCIYVPIGEFVHLYLPALLLKMRYPKIKLVVDILNFENLNESIISLSKRFRLSGSSYLVAIILAVLHKVTFTIHSKTLQKVDFIFSVSPFLVEEISKVYKKDTISFTPSGVESIKSGYPEDRKGYLGVYLGRVTEQKGMFNLVLVWAEVVKRFENAQLAIAGVISDSDRTILNALISKHWLEKNITVFGKITENHKSSLLSQSEIFLHLAEYEPLFPVIGILEGMSMGLPAVVFDNKSIGEEDRKIAKSTGIIRIVPKRNIQQTSSEIINIFSLTLSQKRQLSAQAINYATKFDWKTIAAKEWKVIDELTLIDQN